MRQENIYNDFIEGKSYVFTVTFCASKRTDKNYRIWKFVCEETNKELQQNLFSDAEKFLLKALGYKSEIQKGKEIIIWDNEEVLGMGFIANVTRNESGYYNLINFKSKSKLSEDETIPF